MQKLKLIIWQAHAYHKRPKPTSTIAPWKSQRPSHCWKCAAFRVYIYSQKALWVVPSAYCSKRRIRMRACHAHVLNPHLLFFSLSLVSLSLEGFLGTSATDDFDLFNLRLVYILIMYGVLLVPSPVTLVVDLREIEGRTPLV